MPFLRFLPLLLVVVACAPDTAIGPGPDDALVFKSHVDYQVGVDLETPGDGQEVAQADTAVDAPDASTACSTSGGFACPCTSGSDCASGYCVEGDQGKVCAAIDCYNKDCPSGWTCVQTSSGDPTTICVPANLALCMPCATHADCRANGQSDNYCVPFDRSVGAHGFIDGSFCTVACTPLTGADGKITDTCKAGSHCQELKLSANADVVKQCVPDSGECGCRDSWSQEGKSTACYKTSDAGKCVSKRQCQVDANGKAILTVCDAPDPATEVCGDGIDNDCNGQTDEPGASGCKNWYLDNDSDGFGSGATSLQNCLCSAPGDSYVKQGGDCNDLNSAIHPGAVEICNNIDDNCNGETDEPGTKGCTTFFHDVDGDGFGNPKDSKCICLSKWTAGWVQQAGDCSDTTASIHAGVTETCDGVDNNCDGKIDEGFCDDGNSCTADLCSAVTPSECVHASIDGTPCDDGNPCTLADTCTASTCVGAPACGNGLCDCSETPASCPSDCSVTCGNGVCDGAETAAICAMDCGFLTNHLGAPCTTPWSWSECPAGFICVARSMAGGGNVCVADFETWAPLPDSHPASDYTAFADYAVDNKTGLWWTDPASGSDCAMQQVGGFVDWRHPTLGELESLLDITRVSSPSSWAPIGIGTSEIAGADGSTPGSGWLVHFWDATISKDASASKNSLCVRGGATGGTGSGTRFVSPDGGLSVLDRISGLTWQTVASPAAVYTQATAKAWCDSNGAGLPGTWRVPTLGELRQLANRDSKAPLDGWSFQFADGTYFGCSSSPPDAPPMMYWHLLFPDGETDWGPSNGGDPAVHLACVK